MEQFPSSFGPIELTVERERHIYEFHPDVRRYRKLFAQTLAQLEIIRRSRFDSSAIIFYRSVSSQKYLAIVVKINQRNFILTAYLTYKIRHQPL